MDKLAALTPAPPGWTLDWPAIQALWLEIAALDACPQDPIHHGEGNVGTHTRMVLAALSADPDWRGLPAEARGILFWAAVLHDIGKPATTVIEAGRITQPGHSRRGAMMARAMLYRAGASFGWREAVCGLIAAHQVPFWLITRSGAEREAIKLSWRCRTDLLCLHARADALGRICADQPAMLDHVALAQAMLEELGCFGRPFPFANDESRVAFFERADRDPHFAAHEAARCQVTVMAGLPGSGKDRWIAQNGAGRPVVSLDAIRAETGTDPAANQGRVVQIALERAREFLRARTDFIWNATNVSRAMRGKILSLCRDYEATIEIVYVEMPYAQLTRQNAGRADAVPARVIDALIGKLEPPEQWEAHLLTHVLAPPVATRKTA
ncbi:MAG: AAA family ATPase [Pseudomonadota bacterium]